MQKSGESFSTCDIKSNTNDGIRFGISKDNDEAKKSFADSGAAIISSMSRQHSYKSKDTRETNLTSVNFDNVSRLIYG